MTRGYAFVVYLVALAGFAGLLLALDSVLMAVQGLALIYRP